MSTASIVTPSNASPLTSSPKNNSPSGSDTAKPVVSTSDSDSQLKKDIDEWTRDSGRTTLVLNSVSRAFLRALLPILDEYEACKHYQSIKAFYSSQLQYLHLRKISYLEHNASAEIGFMFLDEIRDTGFRILGNSPKGLTWRHSLSFQASAAFVCPEAGADSNDTQDHITYMQPDGCVKWKDLQRSISCAQDTVLPTVVVLVGVNSNDEAMIQNVERWFKKRKGMSSEINALIYISITTESDTCLSIRLSVYGRPPHFKSAVPLVRPYLTAESPYQLYFQPRWKQELNMTPVIRTLSLPTSVFWGIRKCPKGFPTTEITISAKVLRRISSTLLETYREAVAVRDGWEDPNI